MAEVTASPICFRTACPDKAIPGCVTIAQGTVVRYGAMVTQAVAGDKAAREATPGDTCFLGISCGVCDATEMTCIVGQAPEPLYPDGKEMDIKVTDGQIVWYAYDKDKIPTPADADAAFPLGTAVTPVDGFTVEPGNTPQVGIRAHHDIDYVAGLVPIALKAKGV